MPELDEKKRIIDYNTVNDPDENYYVLVDNGTEGTGKANVKEIGPGNMISDAYSDQDTYAVGDVCIHNNILYVCNTEIDTPHAFDLSEWDPDTLGNYCSKLNADTTEIKQSLSNLGTFYTYSWTAGSSNAYGAQLTSKITLPKGNYILFGVTPVLSVTECAIALTSNNPINAPFTLNNVRTRTLLGYTFQVTQDNTDVWIMAGGSISVSYTGISDASGRIIRVG